MQEHLVAQMSQTAPGRNHHCTELENVVRATILSAITAAVALALGSGCGAHAGTTARDACPWHI